MIAVGRVALLSYTPAVGTGRAVKVWNGSAWITKTAKVWNGSAWVVKTVRVWTGSAWV